MSHNKSLLISVGLGLAILSFGEVTLAQVNQSTLTTGISATGSVSNSVTNVGFGNITVNGIQSQNGGISVPISEATIPIPQDVFQSINTGSNAEPNSTTNVTESTITTNTETAARVESSPEQILVCLTDSCSPGDNSITIKDLASLVETDLNQALTDLVVAEQAASDGIVASDDSRQIVRRESEENEHCGCVPGEINISRKPSISGEYVSNTEIKAVAEARQIAETKLEESSIFVEKINQLNPENSIW